MISALFVSEKGYYSKKEGIDLWDIARDAKKYQGDNRVIAHPPCERWGRYWSGGPSTKIRRVLGDDDGCFEFALAAVRRCGGVLEHPEASHAFRVFELGRPNRKGGWMRSKDGVGWICCVEQGHYGHRARKATWLYFVGVAQPKDLIWGASGGERMDEGFRSTAARRAARAAGIKPIKRFTAFERLATPPLFAELLIELVEEKRTK